MECVARKISIKFPTHSNVQQAIWLPTVSCSSTCYLLTYYVFGCDKDTVLWTVFGVCWLLSRSTKCTVYTVYAFLDPWTKNVSGRNKKTNLPKSVKFRNLTWILILNNLTTDFFIHPNTYEWAWIYSQQLTKFIKLSE